MKMNLITGLKGLVKHCFKSRAGRVNVRHLNRHTLRDIGLNRMAVEYKQDDKLWLDLAA